MSKEIMEVDGPESPDMSMASTADQQSGEKQQDTAIAMMDDATQEQSSTQEAATESDSDSTKARILFEKLESSSETMSLNKKLSLALTVETIYAKNIQVLIRLIKFYRANRQEELAQNLFSFLFQNFTFVETGHFDDELQNLLVTIILHNQQQQQQSVATKRILDEATLALYKTLVQEPDYEFYVSLYLNRRDIQEKLKIQLLDKYRNYFQFLRINPDDTAPLPINVLISNLYKNLSSLDLKMNLFKNLLKCYPKYLPIYGVKLIDTLFYAEKHCFPNSNTELNEQRRSLNLFRKLCVVDLIPDFISLIETKLENKVYYRWIEKSLEFYMKYTNNTIYVKHIDSQSKQIHFGYRDVVLVQDLDEALALEIVNELENKAFVHYTDANPWQRMYTFLDEIGRRLDWPFSELASLNNGMAQIRKLFESKKQSTESGGDQQVKTNSNVNKQISFFGISLFFDKLTEMQAVIESEFSSKIMLAISFNEDGVQDVAQLMHAVAYIVEQMHFILDLWHKLSTNSEYFNVISKCLNNCKMDSIFILKMFISSFYLPYKYSLSSNDQAFIDNVGASYKQNSKEVKNRVNHVVIQLLEKHMVQEAFVEMVHILDDLKAHEDNKKQQRFYSSFSPCLDLFFLDYDNVLKYFSKLFFIKLDKILKKNTGKIDGLNDQHKSQLLILLQISFVQSIYDSLLDSITKKNEFKFSQFFEYIYEIGMLEDFSYLSSLENMKLELSDSPPHTSKAIQDKLFIQVNRDLGNKEQFILAYFLNNIQSYCELLI